jgi:6-pyruvoyltetrahydropterin/6-carboxytetrahydropterin synthase
VYTVSVRRDFIAQHYLVGGDWGEENKPHSHHFTAELRLHGEQLDQHGYLVDIVDIEHALNAVVAEFRDRMLNDHPDFKGLNPSVEHFSRILCSKLSERIDAPNIRALNLKLWETADAWASYRIDR